MEELKKISSQKPQSVEVQLKTIKTAPASDKSAPSHK